MGRLRLHRAGNRPGIPWSWVTRSSFSPGFSASISPSRTQRWAFLVGPGSEQPRRSHRRKSRRHCTCGDPEGVSCVLISKLPPPLPSCGPQQVQAVQGLTPRVQGGTWSRDAPAIPPPQDLSPPSLQVHKSLQSPPAPPPTPPPPPSAPHPILQALDFCLQRFSVHHGDGGCQGGERDPGESRCMSSRVFPGTALQGAWRPFSVQGTGVHITPALRTRVLRNGVGKEWGWPSGRQLEGLSEMIRGKHLARGALPPALAVSAACPCRWPGCERDPAGALMGRAGDPPAGHGCPRWRPEGDVQALTRGCCLVHFASGAAAHGGPACL
nr:uncharacterized protein LOC127484698 [Oryctolagus cuniculus]